MSGGKPTGLVTKNGMLGMLEAAVYNNIDTVSQFFGRLLINCVVRLLIPCHEDMLVIANDKSLLRSDLAVNNRLKKSSLHLKKRFIFSET